MKPILLACLILGVQCAEGEGILSRSIDRAIESIGVGSIPDAMTEVRVGINCHWYERVPVGEAVIARLEQKIAAETDSPKLAALRVCLAVVILTDRTRIDEAVRVLDLAEGDDPNLPEVYNTRGVLRSAKKDSKRAIAEYRKAIALNPNYLDALENLAKALSDAGEPAEAARIKERAMRLVAGVIYQPRP